MRVAKGYKQTEVGIIPEDWEVKPLAKEVDLLTGYPFPSKQYSETGIKLLRGSNIKRGNTDWSEDLTQFWGNVTSELKNYLLQEGDIVIAMDGSLVGKSYARISENDLPILLLQRVARIRSNKIDLGYLKEFVGSDYFSKYCDSVKTVTAIPHISPTDIRKFTIPIPPTKQEQKVIANALSETDALISSLEKLIAKKQNIKQATMQALLTGKKRLKGFHDEWQTKKLSELLDYEQPVNYLVKNTKYHQSVGIPVLTANKSFILGYTDEMEEVFEKVPVIIFDDFTTASRYVTFPFKIKSSAIKILKPKGKEVDLRFVFETIKRIQFSVGDHKRHYISEYQNISMEIPSPNEQKEISKVIDDIDSEIGLLQEQLSKYKSAKQGMMQNLLTGKTRLV